MSADDIYAQMNGHANADDMLLHFKQRFDMKSGLNELIDLSIHDAVIRALRAAE